MAKFTYGGDVEQHYPQYLDVGGEKPTGLVAKPGETYDIEQVEDLTVPGELDEDGNPTVVEVKLAMPPDGRWSEPARQAPARGRQADTDKGEG